MSDFGTLFGALGIAGAVGLAGFVVASHRMPATLLELGKELARRGAGMARKRVSVAGHEVAYFERGSGEPVVLLHGFGANKDGWLQYARGLRGYRLIIPDLPGFGDSSYDPTLRYGFVEQTERLEAFLRALSLGPVHIAGNSMGGGIAGLLAATHPERVKSLLLMDSAAVEMPHLSEFKREVDAGRNPLIVKSVADVDVLLDYVFARPMPVPKIFKRIFASEGMARIAPNEAIFAYLNENWRALEVRLTAIAAPTLIMWGKQDRVLDVSVVDVLEAHIRQHETVIYDPCGHLPYMEVAARASADHRKFIEKHS